MSETDTDMRLQAIALAIRAHESGVVDPAAAWLDTAAEIAEFIDG